MLLWLQRCLPPPSSPLHSPPRPRCHLALPSTAPHAAATLAFSSGTPAAICRRQAWAVKHRDPKFFGRRYASARGPGQMALPTKRGFTAGLKEDDCGQAEDELTPPPPPSSCIALPSAKFQLHSPPKRRRFNISVMIIRQQMILYQPKGQSRRIGVPLS